MIEERLQKEFNSIENGESLSVKIYNLLHNAILRRELKPGDVLVETKLADILNVSRTPVREGIRQLEIEGFVQRVPNKGAVVTGILKEDIKEITLMISVLEGLAARLASEVQDKRLLTEVEIILDEIDFHNNRKPVSIEVLARKNINFHNLIMEMSRRPRLIETLQGLYNQIWRARTTALVVPERRNKAIEDHRAIFNAIKAGDGVKAEEIMRRHILEWGRVLIDMEGTEI